MAEKTVKFNHVFQLNFEKSKTSDSFFFEGVATDSNEDRDGEIVSKESLESIAKTILGKPVLYMHDKKIVLGKVIKSEVTGNEVFIKCRGSKAKFVKDYLTQIEEGVLSSFSIAGNAKKVESPDGTTILKDVDIYEVSVVSVPANPRATITSSIRKALNGDLMEKEKVDKPVDKQEVEKKEEKIEKKEEKIEKTVEKQEIEKALFSKEHVEKLFKEAVENIKKEYISKVVKLEAEVENLKKEKTILEERNKLLKEKLDVKAEGLASSDSEIKKETVEKSNLIDMFFR